jgi:hypothetical protein
MRDLETAYFFFLPSPRVHSFIQSSRLFAHAANITAAPHGRCVAWLLARRHGLVATPSPAHRRSEGIFYFLVILFSK